MVDRQDCKCWQPSYRNTILSVARPAQGWNGG